MKLYHQGVDYVEFVVNDLNTHARSLTKMGFEKLGERTLASRGLKGAFYGQGFVRILLTQPDGSHASERQEATRFLKTHTEGICLIAFEVEDAVRAFEEAIHHGARPALEPKKFEIQGNILVRTEIWTPGNVRYAFIERKPKLSVTNRILFEEALFVSKLDSPSPAGIRVIDHLTNNVGPGEMKAWVEWYKKVFGFVVSRECDQVVDGKRLYFNVVQPEDGRIKIPIHESPHFVERLKGSGIQHIGLLTLSIQDAVRELKKGGIPLLPIPPSYYDSLKKRVPSLKESIEELKSLGILADGDKSGYLLQNFTQDLLGPFFFELIQRKDYRGFGEGNFGTLMQAGILF